MGDKNGPVASDRADRAAVRRRRRGLLLLILILFLVFGYGNI
jgi:hypothetical protein